MPNCYIPKSIPHILVFDSGIGGTSILSQLQKQLPNAHYHYIMDNALLPYGNQSEVVIQQRLICLLEIIKKDAWPIDLILIACNTASTAALSEIRRHTQIPIVGVVPAIKPAVKASHSKKIALLATPATITHPYTKQLITEFAKNCHVQLLASTQLVKLAEQWYWQGILPYHQLETTLSQLALLEDVDQLVLGCTHFPLLKKEIERFYTGKKLALVDSGEAVTQRVCQVLDMQATRLKTQHNAPPSTRFYATAPENIPLKSVVKPRISFINFDSPS